MGRGILTPMEVISSMIPEKVCLLSLCPAFTVSVSGGGKLHKKNQRLTQDTSFKSFFVICYFDIYTIYSKYIDLNIIAYFFQKNHFLLSFGRTEFLTLLSCGGIEFLEEKSKYYTGNY